MPPNEKGAGGQATQFLVVLGEVRNLKIPHRIISLFPKSHTGRPTIGRAVELASVAARYALAMVGKRKLVYLSIAKSRQGFARDAMLIWLARLSGQRITCHLNEGSYDSFYEAQPRWLRAIIRKTLLQVDCIIIVSERLRSMFSFEPELATKLAVVPNPAPSSRIRRISPKSLPPVGAPLELLYLSLLIESKGYLDVVRAVAIARERGMNVRAHFAGPFATNSSDDVTVKSVEQATAQFHELIAREGLEGCIIYHGPVFGDAKETLLDRTHLLVLPTGFDREAQPLCILEAMSFGSPVIATRYRGIPDMIVDGANGVFVPYGDPAAITDAIGYCCLDAVRYERMSANALATTSTRKFNAQMHAEVVLKLIAGELAPSNAAAALGMDS